MNRILLILGLFSFPCLIFAQQDQAENLVSNPGFENQGKSWAMGQAQIDESIKKSGTASLLYTNKDPKNYKVMLTHVTVKGGEVLDFSAWVKGKNVHPQSNYAKKGAGIYIHAYGDNDKSLGGSNPPTISGDFNWTKVEGRYQVPENAKRIAVTLYLVQGTTGTVWFDDVYVGLAQTESKPISLASKSLASNTDNRRGAIYIDSEGFTVKNGSRIYPFGIYLGKGPKQGAWASSNENLQRIKNAGFNTILSYYYGDRSDAEKYLDQASSMGLQVIYNLSSMYDGNPDYTDKNMRPIKKIENLVNRLKNKPALLSWYTGDEITLSHVLAAQNNYNLIKENDINHPVFQINNKPAFISQLLSSADVVGTDPYPIGNIRSPNLKMVGDWTAQTVSKSRDKGVWQAVQIFNKGAYKKNESEYIDPTENQIRNMLFQSVIKGAKGILFYSFHDLYNGVDASGKTIYSEANFQRRWKAVEKVSKEFNQIIPIILANNIVRIPELKTTGNLQMKAWKYNGKTYIMAVNSSNGTAKLITEGGVELTFQGNEAKFFTLDEVKSAINQNTSAISVASISSPLSKNLVKPFRLYIYLPMESYIYFKDSYRWLLTAFGYQPTFLDQSIQNYLTAPA